uniref:Putative chitinase 2 n=1 Tax=Lygus hesperus TaxID=30085 RepID=A0A146LPE1_LYGHE
MVKNIWSQSTKEQSGRSVCSRRIMRVTVVLLCASLLCHQSQSSFIDSIPGVSQLKSLVQVISGDAEGAKKTQENFVNTAPVVSQIKSGVQAAQGDKEGAKKTQEQFAHNLEEVVDSTPIIGHIKGGIHIATGDKEKGEEIIKGASSTTGSVIGGLLGGPAGAILGGAATDALITGVDSAVNKESKPFGLVDYVVNFNDKDAGEHFDQLFGIGLDVVGGAAAKKPSKGGSKKPDSPDVPDRPDSPNPRPDTPQFGAEPPPRGGIDEQFIHQFGPDDMHIDYTLPETMEIARRRVNLPDNYRERLEMVDFRDVNDVDGTTNCYFCTAAAMRDMSATELMNRFSIDPSEVTHIATIDRILTLYRQVGWKDVELMFQGNVLAFHNFVDNNLAPGQSTSFALAFQRHDGTGHVVMMRVWKDQNSNKVNYLTTDYQRPVAHPERFSMLLPKNAKIYYIIHPKTITYIAENDIVNLIDEDVVMSMKEGEMKNNCNGKRVIGYLASWAKHEMSVKQAVRFTNVIYAFVKMDADGGLTIPTDTQSKQRLLDAFVARKALALKGLKLSVSFAVGGWENSQYFSNVVGNNNLRSKFINNILKVLNDYDFDGVDIDWEYPGTGGATEGKKQDKANYVTLLREIREKVGNKKLISIAGAAGEEAMQGFDIKNIVKYVDWIGVMSYDLNGAWDSKWGTFVGPNSPLHHGAPLGYSGKLNINWAIKQYVCKSQTPNKIVLGIPFYGRFWSKTVDGTDPGKYPLFRKGERVNGKFGGDKTYRVLINTWLLPGSGFKLNWDDKTKTPWAIHHSSNLVLSYDNPKSIKEKVNYAVKQNLGGVMIWSVDQDDDKLSLTSAVTGACQPTGKSVNFKCNPLEERRWWTYTEDKDKAGMCGKSSPLYKGFYPVCDPDDPGYGCCSPQGYCGGGPKHCDCKGCVDYTKNPNKLIAKPVKPSRKVQWHVGFDKVKPGQPRCGSSAPSINGFQAICNPDDDSSHCCSPAGYCGSGPDFCQCKGCKDFRKISEAQSLKKVRPADQIRWHVGFDVVKPGEPRCGPSAKKVNGKMAICDPDDDAGYCCSQWGFCGVGDDFCKCKECINSKTIRI